MKILLYSLRTSREWREEGMPMVVSNDALNAGTVTGQLNPRSFDPHQRDKPSDTA